MTIRIENRLFGTRPIVVHCPGALPLEWFHLERAVLAEPARRTASRDLTLLTWNSPHSSEKPPGSLERSLDLLGVAPVVLGRDVAPWRNIAKLRLTADALAQVATPIVAGLDSSDVLVLDDPSVLVQRFCEHFTADLVFNATGPPCWPILPEFIAFEASRPMAAVAHGRNWLNSGVWIGRTDFCRQFFAQVAELPAVAGFETSDQAVIKRAWPHWYPRVTLDYTSILFQSFKEDPTVIRFERPLLPFQVELRKVLSTLDGPLRGAEVGGDAGYTADALLREFDDMTLWLIDPANAVLRQRDGATGASENPSPMTTHALFWTRHAANRRFLLEEPSPFAAGRFDEACLDFVLLGARPLRGSTNAALNAWWPKIRRNGYLFGLHGVADGGDEDAWRARAAVVEFGAAHDRPMELGDEGVWWLRR